MSGAQLTLAAVEAAEAVELLDAELVSTAGLAVSGSALSSSPPPVPAAIAERNLFGEAERIAAARRRRHAAAVGRASGL